MFHVKDDFRAGAPVTQVGAGWFNKVGSFINNLVGGRGVRIVKNESGPSYIELEGAATDAGEGDNPTAVGSYPTDEVTQAAGTLWQAGGENGAEVMFAYKCEFRMGMHWIYAAKLVLSADGRVLRIEKAENAGWKV